MSNTKMKGQDRIICQTSFCIMCLTNLLLSVSLFSILSVLPLQPEIRDATPLWKGSGAIALFGLGIYLFGPLNSYLVETYRRKRICILSILILITIAGVFCIINGKIETASLRILQGAVYGLVQMSLGSTLLNDLVSSKNRTQADYIFSWSGRLGIPLGLFCGFYLQSILGVESVFILAIACGLFSLAILFRINVPFKAPLSPKKISLDRFWQPQATFLFFNLLICLVALGILIGSIQSFEFYGLMTIGFISSWGVQRIFENADLRSEVVIGLLLTAASILLIYTNESQGALHIASFLSGLGFGLFSSRLFLYFLKLSGHCQRGTLQHTYTLGLESGIYLGYWMSSFVSNPYILSIGFIVLALIMYVTITHSWFMKHRDRSFRFREI